MQKMIAQRSYRFLLEVGKIAGGASFIFGIFYGAYQFYQAKNEYYEVKQEKRIEKTLEFFKQFSSSPLDTYRANVFRVLYKNKEAIARAAVDEDQLARTVIKLINDENIAVDTLIIFDFFDGLNTCATRNVCDQPTTVALFQARAHEIYIVLYQYIALQRKQSTDFGVGLERIAKKQFE
jgi:hypothetical protein